MKQIKYIVTLSILCICNCLYAQNTVGLISYESDGLSDGYTLLYPLNQPNVYLINNCGEVVHEWPDSTIYRPGNSVYLLNNGNLLKTKRSTVPSPGGFFNGGAGGIIELLTWENEVIWSKEIVNSTFRAHHDVEMMPNGNVLCIVWQRRSREDFLQAGGDTTLFDRPEIWPDIVQEYNPSLDSIVWEWDAWDHLVQDYDESKDNFGDVANSPGKIDLNYDLNGFGNKPDWMHSNSIDYNEELDQIILSVSQFEEMWIIDHSTTKEEVKGNTGGKFGKGGQLLFRWGNPRAYKQGDVADKKLFFQHDVQWFDAPELSNHPYYNQIGVFNNRPSNTTSSVHILEPWLDLAENEYTNHSGTYLPSIFSESLESREDLQFQSSNMSSVQLLPNGNYFICAAQRGAVFEISPNEEIVWSYVLPFRNGFRISQGSNLNIGDNVIFRAKKYGSDFPGFEGKNLDPTYYLELEPNTEFCDLKLSIENELEGEFSVFPVPTQDILTIKNKNIPIKSVQIVDNLGREFYSDYNVSSGQVEIDVSNMSTGLCYIILNNKFIYKTFISNK